jgi:hypothetical protein
MAAIRRCLKPDGLFLICDINSKGPPAANIAGHPLASLMYGFSVSVCMGSGLSGGGGGGLGLGTLGFPQEVRGAGGWGARFGGVGGWVDGYRPAAPHPAAPPFCFQSVCPGSGDGVEAVG